MAKVLNASLEALGSSLPDAGLPGARTALDRRDMRGHLQAALLDPGSSAEVTRCDITSAILVDPECLVVRYALEVDDAGTVSTPLVTGRVFPTRDLAAAYENDRLAPLVAGDGVRPPVPLTTSVALVEPLAMVLHAFPVDGELPTLMAASDPGVAGAVLQELLARGGHADVTVAACRVEPAHYNRRHRCMLRYRLDLAGGSPPITLYGKVANDGSGARTPRVVEALRGPLAAAGVAVPECLGFREDLQLVAFTEIAGVPRVAQLLKERLRGERSPGEPTLESALVACARIAAVLHTSRLQLGTRRSLPAELATLRAGLAPMRRLSPALAGRLDHWLDVAEGRATATPELQPVLCHGDFSYTQLVFDGQNPGLVDFDNVCQAEPALDLGQFLAYLRYAGLKARHVPDPGPTEFTERLAGLFTGAYTDAGGSPEALTRIELYEATNLVRMAEHAWQNLKGRRLEDILSLLSRRLAD